jgi:hypothetical protein
MREDDRARWTRLVLDFESADLSQREFAQERGLPLSNLWYWICRLRQGVAVAGDGGGGAL